MYAVLDIETTGGKYNEERITEIAIYKFDGNQVLDSFASLINPEKKIQDFVVKLTGINNKMLLNAPKFYEVAKRILEITENCILVAHNSSFDYRVIKNEYKSLGYQYNKHTLCTVELSQQLIPEAKSHSLGKLCKSLGIPVSKRHRADGDAMATVNLFKILLQKDINKNIIEETIKFYDNRNKRKKINSLKESVPEKTGVFYMQNKEGVVIFMGRSSNMKKEVLRIFLKESKRAKKIQQKVHSISYELTGNELISRLKYYTELEALKPKFNIIKKQRKINTEPFYHSDMLLVEKGREIEENSVILIENNEIVGYGFTNLNFQEKQIDVLKSILTPIENKVLGKTIVKNYLRKKNVKKIIRF